MKFLIHMVLLLAVTCLISTFAACGVNKDEHEKIVSERNRAMADLAKAQGELDKMKTEMEEIKIKINKVKANHGLTKKKSSLTKTHNQTKRAFEKCSKEKKALESSFIAARREVAYLRDKMDELINSFKKVSNDLNLAEKANEILNQQMKELIAERDRIKNPMKNR